MIAHFTDLKLGIENVFNDKKNRTTAKVLSYNSIAEVNMREGSDSYANVHHPLLGDWPDLCETKLGVWENRYQHDGQHWPDKEVPAVGACV